MRNLFIGAAAMALAASGAMAEPGGKGNGNGGGKGGHEAHGPSMKADKGPGMKGPGMREAKAERGSESRGAKDDRESSKKVAQDDMRKADRRADRQDRETRNARRDFDNWERRDGDDRARLADQRDRRDGDARRYAFGETRGLIDGCPPGLAKKDNGCMPPGLTKKRDGDYRVSSYRPDWFGYGGLTDGRYFYDNGYLYRTDTRGSVLGYVPLLGGALSVGSAWPSYYQPVSVPDYYVDYYNLGSANSYRYADDVLYRVDPETSAITAIVALLTGDRFAVGQQLPSGYDVYNVPYAYQDRYVDGPDAAYRYSDGYVYQVDPTTQLIEAAIQLLS